MKYENLTVAYADSETEHILDLLETQGIECHIDGNEVRDQYGNRVEVLSKCWGIIIVFNGQSYEHIFHDIKDFLQCLYDYRVDRCYFHNLRFDDSFLASYMKDDEIQLKDCTVKSVGRLMSNKNVLYSDVLEFTGGRDAIKHRRTKHKCQIWDSFKIWSSSLREMGKDFGVYKMGEDHEEALRVGCDERMEEYCLQDCRVLMVAMQYYFSKCNEESKGRHPFGWMTAASTSYHLCMMGIKAGMRTEDYALTFPPCNDTNGFPDWLREGYKGAVPLLDPEIRGKILHDILVFDVNSMYPDKLRNYPLPIGKPIPIGEKTIEHLMDLKRQGWLWVAKVKMIIKVKEGHRATFMLKRKDFNGNTLCDYCNDFDGMFDSMESFQVITSVDIEYIMRDYYIHLIEVEDAVAFRTDNEHLMAGFIDRWYAIKSEASAKGDKPLKAFAKLILNSLYGKFGANPEHTSGFYEFSFDNMIRVKEGEVQTDACPLYLPIAMFTTAYARNEISQLCNAIGWKYVVYTDTDSLHIVGLKPEIAKQRIRNAGYRIHKTDLGALDFESRWGRGMYVRNKGYFHEFELDTETGVPKLKANKHGVINTVNETKMGGVNGVKWSTLEDVYDKEMYGTQTRGYRVKGGTILMDKPVTISTSIDACIKTKRKIKGKTQRESDMLLKQREQKIWELFGVS